MNVVKDYRDMLAQQPRIEAFKRAIGSVVREGDKVLEVGAGLGTFSFFAADAGAAHVWAVDGEPIIHVAKAIAKANGYADRVEFIRDWIPGFVMPDPCDVLIYEDFAPRLLNASRFRLLRTMLDSYTVDDVRSVPLRAQMKLAPVSSARVRKELLSFEDPNNDKAYGIDWHPTREYVVNFPTSIEIRDDDLAAPPVAIGEVSLDRIPDGRQLGGTAEWTIETACTVHGLAYWFDLEVAAGEWLSNGPGVSPASWGHLFLPAEPPLEVRGGRVLVGTVGPDILEDGAPGWLNWSVTSDGVESRGSEFAGKPASLQDMQSLSPDAVPELKRDAVHERDVLSLTDGVRTIGEIAEKLRSAHPEMSQAHAEHAVAALLRGKVASRVTNEV